MAENNDNNVIEAQAIEGATIGLPEGAAAHVLDSSDSWMTIAISSASIVEPCVNIGISVLRDMANRLRQSTEYVGPDDPQKQELVRGVIDDLERLADLS